MFTDSLNENVETIRELLAGMPATARPRAQRAAVKIEKLVMGITKDNPKDPATGLGVAFAVMLIAQQMVQSQGAGEKSLIQLL